MANPPKRVTDPTEAALSAIQDALSIRETPSEPEPVNNAAVEQPAPVVDNDEPLAEPPWRGARASAAADEMLREDAITLPDEQIALRSPANDDRESIGQGLRTPHPRPPRNTSIIPPLFPLASL